jgi:hypothetical protein
MINNFKKIFGKPGKVIITISDWEQKKQMKYKETTKGIAMHKLFRQNNFKVYLECCNFNIGEEPTSPQGI